MVRTSVIVVMEDSDDSHMDDLIENVLETLQEEDIVDLKNTAPSSTAAHHFRDDPLFYQSILPARIARFHPRLLPKK